MAALSVQLLGYWSVSFDGTPVLSFNSQRVQDFLAYLILHRETPQPRSQLAYQFWLDSSDGQARANLRTLLHYLRNTLPEAERFLHVDNQVVFWRVDPALELDVAAFESAVERAERADQAADVEASRLAWHEALTHYRGDLLPLCYADWIIPYRNQLQYLFMRALKRLAELHEGEQDYSTAIRLLQRCLEVDPYLEEAYRRLMRLLVLTGERAGALRVYQDCVTLLAQEFHVQPSHATCEVYEQVIRQDAVVRLAANAELVIRATGRRVIGRSQEWDQLNAAWRMAAAGKPSVILLVGENGIGRTHLAEAFVEWAGRQGHATAGARCYADQRSLAYTPVIDWLRARPLPALDSVWIAEIARVLPEVLTSHPEAREAEPAAEGWQRPRLFEALARAVLGHREPLLLFLDDIQWCDSETLAWLPYLLRYRQQSPLLVIASLRPEDLLAEQYLASFLQALRRSADTLTIELGPLNSEQTVELATTIAGTALTPDQAGRLYAESEGIPLFIVEMLRAGWLRDGSHEQTGQPEEHGDRTWCSLPPTLRRVIGDRLISLSVPARDLVHMASAMGRRFSSTVLQLAGDMDEATFVSTLDELVYRGILHEHDQDTYDFSRDKLREYAYASLSSARRRLLHRRIAQALTRLHSGDALTLAAPLPAPAAINAELAFHHEQAGQLEQAAHFHQLAAKDKAKKM